jgi:hypothetical protein
MRVPAIQGSGSYQPLSGYRKAMNELARTPPVTDAVHLSREAMMQNLHQIEYSLNVTTEKVRDEIADIVTSLG